MWTVPLHVSGARSRGSLADGTDSVWRILTEPYVPFGAPALVVTRPLAVCGVG